MIRSLADALVFLREFHRDRPRGGPTEPDPAVLARLPRPLAALHRGAGDLLSAPAVRGRRPLAARDRLRPTAALMFPNADTVEFADENQGCWTARCACGPAAPADPPVSLRDPTGDVTADHFGGPGPPLSRFLIGFCLREAVMSCGSLAAVRLPEDADRVLTVPVEDLYIDADRGVAYYHSREPAVIASLDPRPAGPWGDVTAWVGRPDGDVRALLVPGLKVTALSD